MDNVSYEKPRQEITQFLNTHFPGGVGCEVGVCKGEFSRHLLENWNCKLLYLVDIWEDGAEGYKESFHNQPDNFRKMMQNLDSFKDRVVICKGDSTQTAKSFQSNMFDFIYIDANHSYEGCKNDIESFWPKLKPGGVMMFDDYTLTPNEKMDFIDQVTDDALYFGVNKAVKEFAEKNKKIISLEYTGDWIYHNGVKSRNALIQKS